jgi:glycosyltransferase involved in cell wall biosynthesis
MLTLLLFLVFLIVFYPFFEIRKSKNLNSKFDISFDFDFNLHPVSVILCVYNEEKNIENKLLELINELNSENESEIIIVSGGSTDKTDEIINDFLGYKIIHFYKFPENISKIEAINFAVNKSKNNVLIFSDCRQKMKPNSIRHLVYSLINKNVALVAATLINKKDHQNSIRTIINKMNISKSSYSNSMNVYGALYAQKKESFRPIPTNILFDDLYVLASTLAQNHKIIQIENAVIEDANFVNYYQKDRIQRLTRGLLLFLFRHYSLIFKMKLKDAYQFLMSKYAKLLLPFLFLGIFITLVYRQFKENSININFFLLFFIISIFLHSKGRRFYLINYFVLEEIFNYLFLKKRSVRWEKFTNY